MRRATAMVAAGGLIAAALTGFLAAQDSGNATRAADEAAIRAASQSLAQAFEKGDAAAFTALWTEDAEYVDQGAEPVRGRAALAKAYTELFAKRVEVKAEVKTDAIRFLGKDTAIEEGTFTVKAKDTPPNASRFSALYVRQDGKWLIALLKEWGDETTARARLHDIEWIIGTWESDGPEMKASTTYEWAENKSFIRVKYSITPKKAGEKTHSGMQIIGVDPAIGTVRAWTFDADGGIGEAFWEWDGERWVIDSVGTLADGMETTARNFLARSGNDAFTWRSVMRTAGGEPLPDLGMVTVKRAAGGR